MILHLLENEKVTHRTITLFEEFLPNLNIYVCFYKNYKSEIKSYSDKIIYYNRDTHNLSEEINYNKIDKIIIHALHDYKIEYINKCVPTHIPIFWAAWGKDLYDDLLALKGFKMYYLGHKRTLKCFIRDFMCNFMSYKTNSQKVTLPFLKNRVNYMMADDEYELDLLKFYYPKYTTNIKYLDFFYYQINEMLKDGLKDKWSTDDSIFIGNSAVSTNNHLYSYKFLRNINIGNRAIIAPLNYNIDDYEYLNRVIKEGQNIFGNKFQAVTEFLSLSEYNKLMLSSSIYIYGFFRPQALGNIVIALYLGAKVFLPRRCPTYTIMKKRGIHIFALEDISNDQINTPLTQLEKEENRKIVYERYNRDSFAKLIKETFCPKSQDE